MKKERCNELGFTATDYNDARPRHIKMSLATPLEIILSFFIAVFITRFLLLIIMK